MKDDPAILEEYEQYHREVWMEIITGIKDVGVLEMEIYRTGNRLFMIMETDKAVYFEKKTALDSSNSKVQEWEDLMWKYQKAIPGAKKRGSGF